jgi:hypothetical protein
VPPAGIHSSPKLTEFGGNSAALFNIGLFNIGQFDFEQPMEILLRSLGQINSE